MNLTEINEKIFPEDKMIAAVSNEVSEDYVNRILRGNRKPESEKAKAIVKTLRKLARVNETARNRKEAIANVIIK